ncbi:MAG TPA: ion channel [Longimicrobiaceae bacterium]|nr:ion channel [Longimicrobiaceae bacterium]
MRQHLIAAGAGALLLFLLVGGLWVGLSHVIPAGLPRSIFIVAMGFVFLTAYVWLLVARVRVILKGTRHLLRHGLIAVAQVLAMLVSFGAVYQKVGIIDSTRPDSPVVHEFWTSVYYSVVTFTTLGYGDFYPQGVGRALAGMQALTGYIILGVLASVAANVVSPHSPAGRADDGGDDGDR